MLGTCAWLCAVMGINLNTLRPEPCVEGHTTPGGYSSKAVKPIALAKARLTMSHLHHASYKLSACPLPG